MTTRDLIKRALRKINVLAIGQELDGDTEAFCLDELNEMLDFWNAQRLYAYNVGFSTFTLTANHQPHTVGPSGCDFLFTTNRPVEILAANIVQNNITLSKLNLRDDQWWANERVKTLATSLPTDLYYSPDFPKGSMFLWPIPTQANQIEIETRFVLAQLAIGDTISLPPAYLQGVTCSFAEKCCAGGLGPAQVPIQVASDAMRGRAAIKTMNSFSPKISTRDSGMPNSGGKRTNWNYLTGGVNR